MVNAYLLIYNHDSGLERNDGQQCYYLQVWRLHKLKPYYQISVGHHRTPSWCMPRNHSPKHILHNLLILDMNKIANETITLAKSLACMGILQRGLEASKDGFELCFCCFTD
ncbi:hypothetical protein Ao3042_04263 [Aspergillus oryzae 3.042]|uniref:Uncharacterized protein n=1 Tax=Aspergillus oryzae (strain 3.042) TaxID=1160506 RepID=I8A3G9_ASPO3|nr:hypothetical protein Ao3042_04263 [Aspergillus oryzae 3.042]|eukprot:EIT79452.1 hypothetical protein Ao3042_04263 [Aspergillus oryzae 3.042]